MFSKNPQISNLMKSRLVPCGQTDMTKPTVTSRNFADRPKNEIKIKI